MAMKCMAQTPVPPIAHAASRRYQARRAGVDAARARTAQPRPKKEPSTDSPYARIGVIGPYMKWSIDAMYSPRYRASGLPPEPKSAMTYRACVIIGIVGRFGKPVIATPPLPFATRCG